MQQQQQRDRILSLLYLCSYFCRPAGFLMHAQELLPELGVADLFELEQHKRRVSLPSIIFYAFMPLVITSP